MAAAASNAVAAAAAAAAAAAMAAAAARGGNVQFATGDGIVQAAGGITAPVQIIVKSHNNSGNTYGANAAAAEAERKDMEKLKNHIDQIIAAWNKSLRTGESLEVLHKDMKLQDLPLAEKWFAAGAAALDAVVYVVGKGGAGTGFMIAPNLMATAAHVLIDPRVGTGADGKQKDAYTADMTKPREAEQIVDLIDAQELTAVFGYHKPVFDETDAKNQGLVPQINQFPDHKKCKLDAGKFLFYDGVHDVAVVALKTANAEKFMPLQRLPAAAAGGPMPGDVLAVVGHHDAKTKRVGKGSLVSENADGAMEYTCPTMAGGSGSPIYALTGQTVRVAGVHRRAVQDPPGCKPPRYKRVTDANGAVEQYVNGGTSVNAFIHFFEAAKQAGALIDSFHSYETLCFDPPALPAAPAPGPAPAPAGGGAK